MNIQKAKTIKLVDYVDYSINGNTIDKTYKRKETDNQINYDFKDKNIRVVLNKQNNQWKYYDYNNSKSGDIVNFTMDYFNIKDFSEVLAKIESINNEINNDKDFWEFNID